MTKENRILDLNNHYKPSELLKSVLTGLLFFTVPSSLLALLFANIVVLYVPYLIYLLLALYIGLVLISLFSNKVLLETLLNYQDKSLEINYKIIYKWKFAVYRHRYINKYHKLNVEIRNK